MSADEQKYQVVSLPDEKSIDEAGKIKLTYRPQYFQSNFQEIMFVLTLILSQIANQGASTQTLTLFKTLSQDLNASQTSESWLMTSFSLSSGSLILITGHLGDIYGWKRLVILGYVIAIMGALVCGFSHYSHSVNQFIVSRAVLQGLGISCILPNLVGLLGHIYVQGSTRKFIIISMLGSGAPTGAFFGCFFPSWITNNNPIQNWPWVFYSYAIFCFVTLILCVKFIPDGISGNNKKPDWMGMCLGVFGLAGFNFAWNQAGIDGWEKGYNIGILLSSIISLILFYFAEKKNSNPILDPKVIKNFKTIILLINVLLGWGSFGIGLFYIYQIYLNVSLDSPITAGVKFMPFWICGIIACALVPKLITKITPIGLTLLSSLAFLISSIMISVTPSDLLYWKLQLFSICILSFGMDFSFPSSQIVLSDLLPNGNAGSLVSTMTNYGMSLFLGIAVVIQREVALKHPKNFLLDNFRAGQYLGIGVAFLACLFSVILLFDFRKEKYVKDR
ncbi:hypothetical protein QEN19_001695 [Hanseniaspora menglaensis]